MPTVESWAYDFIRSTRLEDKLSPPPPPAEWSNPSQACVLAEPGRPAELIPREKAGANGYVVKTDFDQKALLDLIGQLI